MAHATETAPAPHGAHQPRYATGVPHARMAIWWFFASEITIFGGLVASYVLFRIYHPEWIHEAHHLKDWAGVLNTIFLVTSSLTIVMAQDAAEDGQFDRSARLMWATFLLGCAFLGMKAFEYGSDFSEGIYPTTSLFWSFYFFMTGLHGMHLLAGLIAIAAIAIRVRRGYKPAQVGIVSLYWHFVDIVWAFLFPTLYLLS